MKNGGRAWWFRLVLGSALCLLAGGLIYSLQQRGPRSPSTEAGDVASPSTHLPPAPSDPVPGANPTRGDGSAAVPGALDAVLALLSGPEAVTPEDRARLIQLLQNDAQPLKARRQAARLLARTDSPEALEALAQTLTNAPPHLKAAIGESLGEMSHPQARLLLLDLLQDPDETAVRGAIRGLANQGNLETVDILEGFLRDPSKSESVRTEAALALGGIQEPNAFRALALAALELDNESVRLHAIQSLGQRPMSETGNFLRGLLAAPETQLEMRTEILSSLANSPEDPHPFLLDYLNHLDPEIRAAAALAMSQADHQGQAGTELMRQLGAETDPNVRLRLYQALGNQDSYDLSKGLALTAEEPHRQTRLEGYRILAPSLRRDGSPELLGHFDQQAVPFLLDTALTDRDLHGQLTSVMALSQARTPSAVAALEEIARHATNPQVVGAANIGLKGAGLR